MGRLADLAGKSFGLWTVLARAPNKYGQTQWFCRCACGHEATVGASRLMNGGSKSCGCRGLRKEYRQMPDHHNQRWTEQEIKALRIGYPVNGTKCMNWVGDAYGTPQRSRNSISRMAKRLGLKVQRNIVGRKDVWSEGELDAVRKYYPHGGAAAVLPHVKRRSKGAIKLKARDLGIVNEDRYWTPEEDAILLKHYRKGGTRLCEKKLDGRTRHGIRTRANGLGLKYDVSWKPREDEAIRRLYPTRGTRGVMEVVKGRTVDAIMARAALLGVKSSRHKLDNYLIHGNEAHQERDFALQQLRLSLAPATGRFDPASDAANDRAAGICGADQEERHLQRAGGRP
jgi:hypothetical protein